MPENLQLAKEEVHIWKASLNPAIFSVQELFKTLSPEEKDRANRFFRESVRSRFILARALLRKILRLYTHIEPHRIGLRYDLHGKPALAHSAYDKISFNVSHSHNLALYALAYEREVGVDIEQINAETDCMKIAQRFFSPDEIAELRDLPVNMRTEAFFRGWVRKEAFVKAMGQGLSIPLNEFSVSLSSDEPIKLKHSFARSQWTLKNIPIEAGYAAAVAAEGCDWEIKLWEGQGHLLEAVA